MPIVAQNRRLFTLSTPLGEDAFLMTAFRGREELSRPFTFTLELVSENLAVAPADLVGQPIGWTVNYPAASPRQFHGYVRRLVAGPQASRKLRSYRAEVVPWLWFLTRATDCRIYQNKSVVDIFKDVFDRFGFSANYTLPSGSYSPREYCVQYRETAFDFVSRLMEEFGIFYSFTFEAAKHTLVLSDATTGYFDCAPHAKVEFRPESTEAEGVYRWDRAYEFGSGKSTYTDYNFETPATNLAATSETGVALTGIKGFELFDYPGRYKDVADGKSLVKVRIEEVEAGFDTAVGSGRCSSFAPGGKFEMTVHPADNGKYVVLAVDHSGTESWIAGTQTGTADYRNDFTCMPATTVFRPARTTPRPLVHGPQPAIVVGPSGAEIYADKYGRVKVQFYWDRVGTNDDKSSCWMRVAELWAGQNWGMVFTPRIGQEVLVEFLEGDPDQPVVTGRVYNAGQMPPYTLPDNMTQSGIKTRSTTGGGTADFNELRFEDKKDSEDIYFHAQKDFHRVVENDDALKVGHDQTIEIKNNRTEVVQEGFEKITVSKGDRTIVVSKGNDTHQVQTGKRVVEVESDDSLTVKTGNREVTVKTGNDTHTVNTGNREVTVELGNDTLTVKAGNQTVKVNAGSSSTEAMQSITLKVGSSQVTIDQMGVSIKGMNITVEGTMQTKISGVQTEVSGTAMAKLGGGIIMIG
jgi:type VI secretion system secreted protein VgrG